MLDIEIYSKSEDIILQDDFHACTGTEPEIIQSDDSPFANDADSFYVSDIKLPINNLDSKRLNNSGKSLLSNCQETSLRIVDSTMIGDLLGIFTSIHYNGCSVIDYTLVFNSLLKYAIQFKVHNFSALSDICPIVCSIMTAFQRPFKTEKISLILYQENSYGMQTRWKHIPRI